MVKLIAISSILLSCMAQSNSIEIKPASDNAIILNDTSKNIYQFKVASLDGTVSTFQALREKKS